MSRGKLKAELLDVDADAQFGTAFKGAPAAVAYTLHPLPAAQSRSCHAAAHVWRGQALLLLTRSPCVTVTPL